MDSGEVLRSVMEAQGMTQYRLAKDTGVSKQSILNNLNRDARTSKTAQLLDALGYDLQAVPRRGTKAADGTKARPYTIAPPRRDKLAPPDAQGKIEPS